MRDTIVFLFRTPITKLEIQRFGFEYLRAQGFKVYFYDLSILLKEYSPSRVEKDRELSCDYIKKITSYNTLEDYILRNASRGIFVDCIEVLSDPCWNSEKIYRLIKKYKAKYIIVESAAAPPLLETEYKKWSKRIKSTLSPVQLFNFFVRKITVKLTRMGIYPKPERLFGVSPDIFSSYIARREISPEKYTAINSNDYDLYADYLSIYGRPLSDNTCVFLDQAVTHHRDMAVVGLKPFGELYFYSLNKLFTKVEQETGLKVVIAAHPRSHYEEMPNVFGNRPVIRGRTIDLVAKSSLVIAHFSTSLNLAVLFKKPLLFIKTNEMLQYSYYNYINTMATAVEANVLNIDDINEFNQLTLDYKHWHPPKKYEEYLYNYIMSRNAGNKTIWNIVADEIRKIE